ncbi:serine hydrolase domain-containing protein [Pontibacter cellulosilyticus]|uniref:Beta-lactamase family protein n=1 Tax=Pontibacter cellulosilyticus TaxID=1720253 RepID=A0A923N830_9BACT|nr:serine hydrolase domain-containing protein [Pontibacter cellulosilyticus]MBC5992195.1 beta-lactamase family protein [Pontibacter cellulosilyticus]
MKKKVFSLFLALTALAVFFLGSSKETNLESFMDEYALENGFSGVVLVAKQGEVLFSKSYGYADRQAKKPNTLETQFSVASLTKSFTAVSVLQLEEKGLLSLKDPIGKYLSGFPNGNQITIEHLLSNSSGISGNYRENLDPSESYTTEEWVKIIKAQPLKSLPGTEFEYSTANFSLLAHIIEHVSNKPYEVYVHENILLPLGMRHSTFDTASLRAPATGYISGESVEFPSSSFSVGGGGLYSTVGDMYLYDQALYSQTILGKAQLEKMQAGIVSAAPIGIIQYGMGWYVAENMITFGHKTLSHAGQGYGFRNDIERFVDDNVTVIVLSNKGEKWNQPALGRRLASIVLNKRFWFWQNLV